MLYRLKLEQPTTDTRFWNIHPEASAIGTVMGADSM